MEKQCKIKYQSILFGNIVFITLVFISLLVLSFVLMNNNIEKLSLSTNLIIAISSFASGMVGGYINRCNGFIVSAILSICQIVILIAIGLISNDQSSIFGSYNLIKILFIVFGNCLGCLVGVNIKKKY